MLNIGIGEKSRSKLKATGTGVPITYMHAMPCCPVAMGVYMSQDVKFKDLYCETIPITQENWNGLKTFQGMGVKPADLVTTFNFKKIEPLDGCDIGPLPIRGIIHINGKYHSISGTAAEVFNFALDAFSIEGIARDSIIAIASVSACEVIVNEFKAWVERECDGGGLFLYGIKVYRMSDGVINSRHVLFRQVP